MDSSDCIAIYVQPRSLRTHTYHSSSPLQPSIPAASEPGPRASASPIATQQQQSNRSQRRTAKMRGCALEKDHARLHAQPWHAGTQALTTLHNPFGQPYQQLLSRPEHPAHHLHAHSISKHAKLCTHTPTCASARFKATAHASYHRQRTHTRTTRRSRLRHWWRQLLSWANRHGKLLQRHSSRERAQQSVG